MPATLCCNECARLTGVANFDAFSSRAGDGCTGGAEVGKSTDDPTFVLGLTGWMSGEKRSIFDISSILNSCSMESSEGGNGVDAVGLDTWTRPLPVASSF
jgi:hypothetical protein